MTTARTYLGLDLGTSGLRGLLTDEEGRAIGSAEAHYAVDRPHPGWSEQNPADWIAACREVFAALRSAHPSALGALGGIGVSGHMHGATLVDGAGDPLRPCILWNDTRSHEQAAAMDADPAFRAISANIVFPGFTAPKLAWVASHESEVFAKTARALLPKDYLLHWLTGDYVGDVSDASGTGWLDTGDRTWSDTLLQKGGMRRDQMPELVEGASPAGELRTALAEEFEIKRAAVVAGGAADNAAAACGAGALGEGDGFVSLGTSGVLLAARDRFAPAPETAVHTFCHAVPGRWYQMGVILAATDSLNWLARQVGQTPQALSEALGPTVGRPGSVRFLPYLSGERTPHNDSLIRGALVGLDVADGPDDLTRAVMEGVAFALRDCLEALSATGLRLNRIAGVGGGVRSPYWVELCATVLGLEIDLPEQGEFGAAMGAARLARCAATGADPDNVMTKPATARSVAPRADLTDAYDDAYQRWRAIYPQLKALP